MDKERWKQKFAAALKSKIDAKGYVITDLGARADIIPANIYKYLDGESMPTAYTINKLASVLDCTTDELINFDLYAE